MQHYFQRLIIYVNNIHASNTLKETIKKKFMIRLLNHENKNQNNDVFNVYKYRFTNIEKTSTFINKTYYSDINFLTNK